jgi:hypothetical protein
MDVICCAGLGRTKSLKKALVLPGEAPEAVFPHPRYFYSCRPPGFLPLSAPMSGAQQPQPGATNILLYVVNYR